MTALTGLLHPQIQTNQPTNPNLPSTSPNSLTFRCPMCFRVGNSLQDGTPTATRQRATFFVCGYCDSRSQIAYPPRNRGVPYITECYAAQSGAVELC